jgi:hypothetical protein
VALVLLATISDAANVPTLSFYLLLAAVPAIVVAGLAALEEVLEPEASARRRAIGVLHVVTLLLVLLSAALRAPLRAEGTVPQTAVSAVIACLAVFAAQALIGASPAIWRALGRVPRPGLRGVAGLGLETPMGQLFGDEPFAEPGKR